MENIEPITGLAQYGQIGVMIGMLMVIGLFGWIIYKIASNHINHSNETFKEVADSNVVVAQALTGLKDIINIKLK